MKFSLQAYCALILLVLWPSFAFASQRALDDAAWRADIEEMMQVLKSNHPTLYRKTSEEDFDAAAETLIASLPQLSDKEIVIEMAKIVAMAHDGHTRLSIPREHDALAFSFSHSAPRKPKVDTLAFSSLPLQFKVFDDELFITAATDEYRHLIGARVLAFGPTPTANAMKRLSSINYNDNFMTDILLLGDRASLPDALEALKIIPSANRVELTLELYGRDGETRITIPPLNDGEVLLSGPALEQTPLWLRDVESVQWSNPLQTERAHFIQLNQIAAGLPDNLLADFMREEVMTAISNDAKRLIIDLRHNHGGNNGFARSVVNAVSPSRYNEYGKFFVIIGRETFSAAQTLANELEKYTDVLFVGEPTGANPDSYGDPKRVQLQNSGLDLRVSRLHWSTWRAFETRTATAPHLPTAYTIDDYMRGLDPALTAALTYAAPKKLSALLSDVFARDKDFASWDSANIIFSRYLTDPAVSSRDFAALANELLAEAKKREAEENFSAAMLLYVSALQLNNTFIEAYRGWARTALAIDARSELENAIEAGLSKYPDDAELNELSEQIDS